MRSDPSESARGALRSRTFRRSVAVLTMVVLGGLAVVAGRLPGVAARDALDAGGEEFVRIALAFAQHEPAEVDAYFGPGALRPAPHAARVPLALLSRRARHLVELLDPMPASARLRAQARALEVVIARRASGTRESFDEEARDIYGMSLGDAIAVEDDAAAMDAALRELERLLPGEPGTSLAARFQAYRARFAVPPDRRRALFAAALDACRARTLAHWTLPSDERLDVKWELAAPGAWHRYDGQHHSTLTLNPGSVEFLDSAIDLACHEGYPGHHAQFLLAEQRSGGAPPAEETIALLRSPVSMLREGAAQYAVDLAFPADERLAFERDVLFPIAGFDPDEAARYAEIRQHVRALEPAIVPILRDYYDRRLNAADAAARLEARALVSSPQALLRFVDDLGPYVLGYTVARDRVAAHVAREDDRWIALCALLTLPDVTALAAPHSALSVRIGSTDAARRAGK